MRNVKATRSAIVYQARGATGYFEFYVIISSLPPNTYPWKDR